MRTASVSETRQQLSSFLNWIKGNRKDVVIENRGQAEAVIIPFADYDLLQEARERRRRQQAVAALKQIALEVSGRNEAMSEAEAQEVADELTTEAINNLAGRVNYYFRLNQCESLPIPIFSLLICYADTCSLILQNVRHSSPILFENLCSNTHPFRVSPAKPILRTYQFL